MLAWQNVGAPASVSRKGSKKGHWESKPQPLPSQTFHRNPVSTDVAVYLNICSLLCMKGLELKNKEIIKNGLCLINHCGPFILYRLTSVMPVELHWSKTRMQEERCSSFQICRPACIHDFLPNASCCVISYTAALQMSNSEPVWNVNPLQKSLHYGRWLPCFMKQVLRGES